MATTVAQVLQAHPDVGRRKARRWARKATGTRPGKIGRKAAALGAGGTKVRDIVSKRRPAVRRGWLANGTRREPAAEGT